MPLSPAIAAFAAQVASLVHADKKREAAKHVADFCKIKVKLDDEDPSKYTPILANWLHWLLNNNAPECAAQLLWTPTQYTPEPQYAKDLWHLFDTTSQGLVMGAGSCGKSFNIGVRMFLEWLRDSDYTTVKVVGPSKGHLEQHLFSHLVSLHAGASLPMPGTVGSLFIGADRRNTLGSIAGIAIPLGQVKKSARLQGAKRTNRPHPHPIFGPRSRMFIFLDEIERIPAGIWQDISNILTQVSAEGVEGFKLIGAYNPTDIADEVAKRAEPPFGWENVNPDEHFRWKSRRGWDVLRLDGERSENVVLGKEIYPGLQTRQGLDAIAKDAGGRDSPRYMTQGRGMYPSQGVVVTVIPQGMFVKMRGEYLWYQDPTPVAACDLALEGGAAASLTLGKWGLASGRKLPPNLDNPKGRVEMFKDKFGKVQPRHALQADQQFIVPKGDSVEMAHRLIEILKKAGVKPEWFCCDRTGHGAGTADIMKHEWGAGLHDVNYSEAASDSKLMVEDTKTCHEEYDRRNSELWYATRAFSEYGYLLIAPTMDATELSQQLTNRWVKTSGAKSRVESKKDYMSRGFLSPDQADSLTLLVHAARKGSGIVLSRLGESVDGLDGEDDHWYDGGVTHRIDASNRTDTLD